MTDSKYFNISQQNYAMYEYATVNQASCILTNYQKTINTKKTRGAEEGKQEDQGGEGKEKYWVLKWSNYIPCVYDYVKMNPATAYYLNAPTPTLYKKSQQLSNATAFTPVVCI